MSNFKINFDQPLLLLIMIPLFAIALYTFFKVNKNFRYTRNRIISLVLCMICAIFACLTLSGTNFTFDVDNEDNELIVLVDSSYSNIGNKEKKDSFVKAVLDNNKERVNVGVVKFGYNQVYAVQIGEQDAYQKYLSSPEPNIEATNLEDALEYTGSLFTNPQMAKIVLLTDGVETDGNALQTVAKLSLDGIKIDVVNFANNNNIDDIKPYEVLLPNKNILVGNKQEITLNMESSIKSDAIVNLYDNDKKVATQYISIKKGINTVVFDHTFLTKGLHQLRFEVDNEKDEVEENNNLYSYVYIDIVDNILIIEREHEGNKLNEMLKEDYKVTVANIKNAPMSLDEMCLYDQIILMNIANKDMPVGFVDLLDKYVSEVGGGLFTVAGSKMENGKEVANTYDREDMKGTKYQDMLPVLAEDYTPPIGVVFVMDVSASMGDVVAGTGKTRLDIAKENAIEGLKALDDRDYVGIVALSDNGLQQLNMTPVADRNRIINAIKMLEVKTEGTVYGNSINQARNMLNALTKVNKKHVIFVTDGDPGDKEAAKNLVKETNEINNITTSAISYYATAEGKSYLQSFAELGGGKSYNAENTNDLSKWIQKDLQLAELRAFEYATFTPEVGEDSSLMLGVDNVPVLDGFYGTRLKRDAKAYLVGEYNQPIYAEWSYGKGRVGSFMCDLHGKWSGNFINNPNGKKITTNIINQLFPSRKLKIDKLQLFITQNNLQTKINAYSPTYKDNHLELVVNKRNQDTKQLVKKYDFASFSGNESVTLDIMDDGLYEYNFNLLDEAGNIVDSFVDYKTFSYSAEYDSFNNRDDKIEYLSKLMKKADGNVISTPEKIYDNLALTYHKTYDPRYVFIAIVLCCFLLDVAVRKFKFKWIHEIIQNKKNKKRTIRNTK